MVSDRLVPAFRVVEAFDVVGHIWSCFISPPVRFVSGALGLQRREKLSSASSRTLPDRLIEQITPLSAISRWNCLLA
jgi:hypothetical protein